MLFRRLHPGTPWLTPAAIALLDGELTRDMVGVEFGSGSSTLWFAARLRHLTSFEPNPIWYTRVQAQLVEAGARNVELVQQDAPDAANESLDATPYSAAASRFPDHSVNFVLVDGPNRCACLVQGIRALKPGGLLVLDNANWYFPHETRSPSSRGAGGTPQTPLAAALWERLRAWDLRWTSNGVSDTALFRKPLA